MIRINSFSGFTGKLLCYYVNPQPMLIATVTLLILEYCQKYIVTLSQIHVKLLFH